MSQGIFAVMGHSLVEFRAAVNGEPGRDLASIGAAQGNIPDLIRQTLRGIADVLRWLHRGMDDARGHVIGADAAVALLESGGDVLAALPDGLQIGGLDEALHIPIDAMTAINDGLRAAHTAVEAIEKLAHSIVPPLEDVDAIRQELVALLGPRQGPQQLGAGALGQLMLRIGISK